MNDAIIIPVEEQKWNIPVVISLALFHIGAVAALFYFSWRNLFIAAFLYWIAGGLGICLGYHRLHTHRSYKVPRWMECMLGIFGTLSLQGSPLAWVATHRLHHQKSDQEGDPHTPNDGAWWSHMGWVLFNRRNANDDALISKYAPDLAKDHFYVLLNRWHWVPLLILSVGLLAWGGMPMFLWCVCLRIVVGLHATWLVNSATHIWGTRRYHTRDNSRNNWWVALITFGEGWHNNHHAHPASARHGLAWYEVDFSWITLKAWMVLGLAREVREAKIAVTVPQGDMA